MNDYTLIIFTIYPSGDCAGRVMSAAKMVEARLLEEKRKLALARASIIMKTVCFTFLMFDWPYVKLLFDKSQLQRIFKSSLGYIPYITF